ncbi:MAG: NADP-dependent isocitrate dehydrogenase [Planctomycetes bacterium]|nr:NADP-dependent isocitrate dehydrogenase [Planctomycetota bacterium]
MTSEISTASSTAGTAAALPIRITVARGDGIGPEIMDATLRILEAAGAGLRFDEIEIGEKVYLAGNTSGMAPEAWDVLRASKVFLKAPITTPRGSGYKSLNVTTRKTLGLFANVRPCVAYDPFVPTKHPDMDVVVIRENEEDTYAGIEHRQTAEVMQCLKLISRPGSERVIRYAFEYARRAERKKISCLTKDNIMKLTDGLFRQVFREIAAEYPEIETEELIVDIGTAWLADRPGRFDVVVTPNLYGDVVSDVTAQLTGSVGLCGSANIGRNFAMFEAIHGSAPDIAGKDLANPSGLLLAAVMMLVHVGRPVIAAKVHNAWLRTIEDGIHTGDIHRDGVSTRRVGTRAFADAVIERLGRTPQKLHPVHYDESSRKALDVEPRPHPKPLKELVGVDVFVDWDAHDRDPDVLARLLHDAAPKTIDLVMITNRGVKVWPGGHPETFRTDHWRCRFMARRSADGHTPISPKAVVELLDHLAVGGIDFVKTEQLYTFDGELGFSLGQGQ